MIVLREDTFYLLLKVILSFLDSFTLIKIIQDFGNMCIYGFCLLISSVLEITTQNI